MNTDFTVIIISQAWDRVLGVAHLSGPADSLADPAVRHELCKQYALRVVTERGFGERAGELHCAIAAGHVPVDEVRASLPDARRLYESQAVPIWQEDVTKPHLLN